MRKLIAANWKENPGGEKKALELFRATARARRGKVDVVICPPFVYLEEAAHAFKKLSSKRDLAVGAQDVFWEEQGAFTSEVGPRMLRSLGVKYAIIGHSERRKWLNETDAMVNRKIKSALKDGLKVILCVGENLAVRKKGSAAAKQFVKAQLKKDLKDIKSGDIKKNLAVAYEPIWAIGTGRSDDPEDARKMAEFIKETIEKAHKAAPRFLYGGSVNGRNIRDYVQYKEIDGALVGGASLKAAEFEKIIKKVNEI